MNSPWFQDDQLQELMDRLKTEQIAAKEAGYFVPIHLDLQDLLCLVANLQLALRHPMLPGNPSEVARRIVRHVIHRVRQDGYSATAEIMETGNDSANDRA